jgi:membrane-associated protease RseP (regulator of RpoE activity)
MYRTKIGLNLMDRLGRKHSEFFKWIGYLGIGVGYTGLFVIVYFLIKNLVTLLSVPGAQSAVSLVVPGVKIPGSPIMIPLITGWLALFIVILVHEFSHGVIARAHDIKVKSSGVFFLGPLMGAFVEPEEKQLRKAKDTTQYSVYAAGPFSNILLALLCLFLLTYALSPAASAMVDEIGVDIVGVTEGYPAADAGIPSGAMVTDIDGQKITNYQEMSTYLSHTRPGDEVNVTADGTVYTLVAAESPSDPRQGYLGLMSSNKPVTELKNGSWWYNALHAVLMWIMELLAITGILSLGIGLANLLPLGPVDGGRMLQVTLEKTKGVQKGNLWWKKISLATLLLLAINIFWPVIKWLGKLFV